MGLYSILRKPDKIQLISGQYGKMKRCFLEEQEDVSVSFIPTENGMRVSVTGRDTPIAFLRCRWYGNFDSKTKFMGDALERAYGNLKFEGFRPERVMPWYFSAVCDEKNIGYGVKVRPDAFVNWQADPSGITLWLDLRCGTNGLCLNGKTVNAAEIVEFRQDGNLFAFLQAFCQKMADSPIFPKQPVYGFNNWYYAYGKTSEAEVLADAALLRELTEGLENRPYMVLDDGWEDISTVETKINSGFTDLKALAGAEKKMGVRPGIWIRPLRPAEGHFTDLRHELFTDYLDPSLDETLDIIAADVERITGEWGYELVKYDYVTFDIFGKFFAEPSIQLSEGNWSLRKPMTNAQAVKRVYRTIYEHANGAVIIGCNCIGHLGSGYFHLHRSGDDTSGREWERTRYMGINTLAFRLCQHKAFFDIDGDCAGCTGDTSLTWKQTARWLELLTDSSTPLFVSIAPQVVNAENKKQLKEAFAKAEKQSGSCIPLDLTDTTMPTRWIIDGKIREYHFDDVMGADITLS